MKRIGEIHKNNIGLEFKIIGLTGERKNNNKIYEIEFLKSGYKTSNEFGNIKKGSIKDYGVPTVYGVGYSYKGCKSNIKIYKTWSHMLERCYSKECKRYNLYGGNGVKVCDRWLYFKNFEEDVKEIANYDECIKYPNLYSLDKDILGDGKLYSKETCMFTTQKEQILAQKRVRKITAIDKEGNKHKFNSISECGKILKIPNANIYKVLRGERKLASGYYFEV